MKFQPEPKLTLDAAQTLALANGTAIPELCAAFNAAKYQHKSPSLCAFLNELEKSGYVYNHDAANKYAEANGIPLQECWDGSRLATLVYMAQEYRRSDKIIAAGWRPLTPEMVREAIADKKKIEVMGENMLGGNVQKLCRPVDLCGQCYVLLPNKRTKGFRADGMMPARIEP